MTYSEKLRDPRWQKRRLEILQRDHFECQECGSNAKELHVHHRFYKPKQNPWAYEDSDMVTLCKDCHATRTDLDERLHACLGTVGTAKIKSLVRMLEYYQEMEKRMGSEHPGNTDLNLVISCAVLFFHTTHSSFLSADVVAHFSQAMLSRLDNVQFAFHHANADTQRLDGQLSR